MEGNQGKHRKLLRFYMFFTLFFLVSTILIRHSNASGAVHMFFLILSVICMSLCAFFVGKHRILLKDSSAVITKDQEKELNAILMERGHNPVVDPNLSREYAQMLISEAKR